MADQKLYDYLAEQLGLKGKLHLRAVLLRVPVKQHGAWMGEVKAYLDGAGTRKKLQPEEMTRVLCAIAVLDGDLHFGHIKAFCQYRSDLQPEPPPVFYD